MTSNIVILVFKYYYPYPICDYIICENGNIVPSVIILYVKMDMTPPPPICFQCYVSLRFRTPGTCLEHNFALLLRIFALIDIYMWH